MIKINFTFTLINLIMELWYWGVKGVSEPIRYLLAYLQVEYEEKNPSSWEDWMSHKKQQLEKPDQYNFPNLPFFNDNGKITSESTAIPYYLIYKYDREDLLGKTKDDKVKYQEIQGVTKDVYGKLQSIYRSKNAEELNKKSQGFLKTKLNYLNQFVGDKDYFLGYLTYLDIQFSHHLHLYRRYLINTKSDNIMENYKGLNRVIDNVRNQKGIKEYLENDPRSKRVLSDGEYIGIDPKLLD